ncbi:MAG: hypothetical protein LC777_15065 [Actinobacteria bacterium]|nr:hypothetical protein [Actinomycetota bacterium]
MSSDGALGVAATWLTPSKAAQQRRIGRQPALAFVLGREPRHELLGRRRILARRHSIRALLASADPLGEPAAFTASHDHTHAPIAPDGLEVCPILPHPGPIVYQDQLEPLEDAIGMGFSESRVGDRFHLRAVPAPVGRPRLFERVVGLRQVPRVGGLLQAIATTRSEQAPDQQEKHERPKDDQHDG